MLYLRRPLECRLLRWQRLEPRRERRHQVPSRGGLFCRWADAGGVAVLRSGSPLRSGSLRARCFRIMSMGVARHRMGSGRASCNWASGKTLYIAFRRCVDGFAIGDPKALLRYGCGDPYDTSCTIFLSLSGRRV